MTTTLATEQSHHTRPAVLVPFVDRPLNDDFLPELAERGLRHYTARIATAAGVGPEAAWCEWADVPSAYIALDQKLAGHPGRDVALIWAAERGWAVAVETGCDEDLLITASLDGDVLPAPDTVATWLRAVLAGRATGTTASRARRRAPTSSAGSQAGPGTTRFSTPAAPDAAVPGPT